MYLSQTGKHKAIQQNIEKFTLFLSSSFFNWPRSKNWLNSAVPWILIAYKVFRNSYCCNSDWNKKALRLTNVTLMKTYSDKIGLYYVSLKWTNFFNMAQYCLWLLEWCQYVLSVPIFCFVFLSGLSLFPAFHVFFLKNVFGYLGFLGYSRFFLIFFFVFSWFYCFFPFFIDLRR